MSKLKSIYLLFSILVLVSSCEKDADIELPKTSPKLVLYSYISPSDTFIEVQLTKSIPFFGKVDYNAENKPVTDAKVEIIGNGQSAIIPFDFGKERYIIANGQKISIIAGMTYQLKVSAPDGFSCSATTKVPLIAPDQITVQIDSSIRNYDGYDEMEYRIISKWKDVAGISNFYNHIVEISYENSGGGYSACSAILSDENKDGTIINQNCITNAYIDPFNPQGRNLSGKVLLLTTDYSYYKYHESLSRYEDDNPFSEPVQIYSNVDGGLGCFGSYLKKSVDF